jgi:hypothetical protein
MLSFKFTPSDRRPIRKIDTSALVAEFEARGGTVRRFHAGETASYDSVKIYLLEQGYQLSMVRNMNCIKRVGAKGRGKAMHWSRIIAIVDELRAAEGKQTFKARKAA